VTSGNSDTTTENTPLLKVLLKARHLHVYSSFAREYRKVAGKIDRELAGTGPSKAQFYRWISGDLINMPHSQHCRVLETMFPDWSVEQLFQPYSGSLDFIPEANPVAIPIKAPTPTLSASAQPPTTNVPPEFVGLYAHRADTPNELWLNLLKAATEHIDLFANASLFLPEDNPEAITTIKKKAAAGVQVRILLGDPNSEAAKLRGYEERLFEGIPGRIQMALAYYRPLLDVDGVEFRLHATSLYNSIFRYDNDMLVNQHIYGTYGYIAPTLHLRKQPEGDLFDTYMRSFDRVWDDESYEYKPQD
jgi:hypothetical protein